MFLVLVKVTSSVSVIVNSNDFPAIVDFSGVMSGFQLLFSPGFQSFFPVFVISVM